MAPEQVRGTLAQEVFGDLQTKALRGRRVRPTSGVRSEEPRTVRRQDHRVERQPALRNPRQGTKWKGAATL